MFAKNKRLNLLIDSIAPNSIIADIGTDHGYLPIESILQKKAKFAYAVDINQKPLNQAIKNIKKANLTTVIQPVLSDGLIYFKNHNLELDYVIISGLGSNTITTILTNDYSKIKNYLICSNTDPVQIRKLIKKNHWFIKYEHFFVDFGRNYWLINISKTTGKKIKTQRDIFFGINLEQFQDPEYQKYLQKRYVKNQEIVKISKDKQKAKELKKWNKVFLKVVE